MYAKKKVTVGILHAIGHKGLVFVWDTETSVLHVRASGSRHDLDTIQLDKGSNVEVVIKGWLGLNQAIADEQNRIAKFEQEAADRAESLYAKEA